MDQVEVSSKPGKGTIVKCRKQLEKGRKGMDHTIALIQKSHEGDDEARAQIVEENTGLDLVYCKKIYGKGNRAGRSVSDRNDWITESNRQV